MKNSYGLVSFAFCLTLAVYSASGTSQACKGHEKSWCNNVLIAKRCGATKFCRQFAWGRQIISQATSCSAGQGFVKNAQQKIMHINGNSAKLDAIAGLCNELNKEARFACKSVMIEAPAEAMDLINSTMRPVAIGNILGLCATHVTPKVEGNGDLCEDCKIFMNDIKEKFIGPEIQAMMRERMGQMCNEAPSGFTQACKSMTDEWVKHLFAYLNAEMQLARVCDYIPICLRDGTPSVNVQNIMKLIKAMHSPVTDVTCKTCKEVMDDLRQFLNSPSFQDQIEDLISGSVCNMMPRHLIIPCKKRVDRYGNLIFDMILAGFDSQLTCEAVRMCPEYRLKSFSLKNVFTGMAKKAVTHLFPTNNILPLFNMIGGSLGGAECTMCQFFFKEVERMIADESSESQITLALYEACNLLPEPWASECSDFIKTNGKRIIDDILRNLPPQEICFSFGLCAHRAERVKRDTTIIFMSEKDRIKQEEQLAPRNNPAAPASQVSTYSGSVWCRICDEIAGIVQRIFQSQQLEVAVETIYKQVCAVLPKGLAYRCDSISNHLIDGVLGGLSAVAIPETICGAIGVCELTLTPKNYNVQVPDILKPRH